MDFDPKDPEPSVGQVILLIFTAVVLAGFIDEFIPSYVLEHIGRWIGSGYKTVVEPAASTTYHGTRRILPILWQGR
ncbi:MAG: hypothetical protein ACK42D_01335 [Candidatus Paceibacteria bacterium]